MPPSAVPSGPAGLFHRVADTYDNVGVGWFRPIAAGLVDELAPIAGERVLDIGCGRGAALAPLARAVGPNGYALGVDLAPAMVAKTADDLRELPQVEVRVADAAAIDLGVAQFDIVASSLVLFFLPEPGAALHQWVDLLVPGGRIGVATFSGEDDENDERWKRTEAVFAPYLPQEMFDARTTGRRGPYASDAGMAALMTAAGAVDVRTAHRMVSPVFRDAEHWIEFSQSHGHRAMWDCVPPARLNAVRAELLDLLSSFAAADGTLELHQKVRYTLGNRPS